MAITIHQNLSYLSGIYNKNPFVIEDETYKDEDNFYYLFYILDSNGTVASLRQPKNVQDNAIFDGNTIARNKVSNNFQPTTIGTTNNENLFYQYKVSYGSTSDGGGESQTNTNIINCFPFVHQLTDSYNITDYFLTDSDGKLLTSFDERDIVLTKYDYYTFNYICAIFTGLGSSNPYRFRYTFYKKDGSSNTYTYTRTVSQPTLSTTSFTSNGSNVIQTVGVGVQNIINTEFDDTTQLSLSYFDDVEYYKVKAETSGGSQRSKEYTFRLKCKSNHTNYQIFYLNPLGAFDAITFNHGNETEVSQKSYTYDKNPWIPTSSSYSFTNGNRGRTIFDKSVEEELTVYSDMVTDQYKQIYNDFQSSPTHILYKDGVEQPLILTNSKITLEDKFSRNFYQIKFTFEYANKKLLNV